MDGPLCFSTDCMLSPQIPKYIGEVSGKIPSTSLRVPEGRGTPIIQK